MHNQQGLESDNDSCNIDKKDKHPPPQESVVYYFRRAHSDRHNNVRVVFLLLRTALRYCRWKNHYYCTDIN